MRTRQAPKPKPTTPPQPEKTRQDRALPWIVAVIAAAVIPYIPSLWGEFTTDDWAIVVKDPLAHGFAHAWKAFLTDFLHGYFGPEKFYYRPLVTLSFQANWEMAGLNPFVFRLTNLLMGVVTALLVFCLARRLTRSLFAAGVAGAVFAVLPSHAEAVGWISGRTDVMSCIFLLGSLLLFIRGYHLRPRFSWPTAVGCALLFACAIFSKESGLAIPLLMAGYVLVFGESIRPREALKWAAVLFVPLAVYLVLRGQALDVPLTRHMGFHLRERLLGVGIAYAAYLRMLFIPQPVCLAYDVFPIGMRYPAIAVAAWTLPVGLGWLSVWARKRVPVVSFCAFWILIALLPVTNIIPTGGLLPADRFSFLASVGSSVLLGWLAWRLYEYRPRSIRVWQPVVVVLICWFVLFSSALTVESNRLYSSNLGWAQGVAKRDGRFLRECSGYYFYRAGMLEEAAREYEAAIEFKRERRASYTEYATVLRLLGKPEESLRVMLLAKERLAPHASIEYNLGIAYAELGDLQQASDAFARAVELQPNYWQAWRNLAKARLEQKHYAEAVTAYERAFSLKDLGPWERIDLGKAYRGAGMQDRAITEFKRAASEDPKGELGKAATKELEATR